MKKVCTLLLTIASLVSLPVRAQLGEEKSIFSVGINGGMNMSSVNFDPKIKQNKQNVRSGGLTIRYISEKYFNMICGVQLEINYSQRGWNEKIEDGTENTYNRIMNYIEIPFLAHLAFGSHVRDKGLQFFLNAGPQMGFFLNEKEKMSDGWDTSARSPTAQYGKKAENKFDYGIAGGTGFELNTKIGHFIVEGRYYYGLSDFFKNSKKEYFGRSAHSYMGIRAAYLFDIFK